MAHVLVLGGGFGGLAAAHELRAGLGPDDEVTLVDRADRFFMGFAKLWELGGIRPLEEGTGDLRRLERHGIRYVRSEITGIDPSEPRVMTGEGEIAGDALVVALGAADSPAHTALLDGRGHNLYDAGALPAMKEALDGVADSRVLVVIMGGPLKCPPAPYEAALLVDERLRQRGVRDRVEVAIATPQPMTLPVAGPDASRYVADALAGRGVDLLAERTLADVEEHTARFVDGTEVEFGVLLGVPSAAPPGILAESGLTGGSGWVEPEPKTLRTRHERVYAVGDCTMIPTATGQLPKAGVFAEAEGKVAARNVLADLGLGEESIFDGHGSCYLEFPGGKVAVVEGDFFAEPEPDVEITPADEESFRAKQEYERSRLSAWLG